MSGCIYKRPDGRCDKPGKYMAFCIGEACASQTPSNFDLLIENPEKMVKLMHCPYRALAQTDPSLIAAIPGFGCVHPSGDITCDDCKIDWLKSPAEKEGE